MSPATSSRTDLVSRVNGLLRRYRIICKAVRIAEGRRIAGPRLERLHAHQTEALRDKLTAYRSLCDHEMGMGL